MKSRISSCNAVALKKDITRFAPAWGLYSVFLALLFYVFSYDYGTTRWAASNLLDTQQVFAVINFGYALLNAQLLFGYLFDSRMCNSIHMFPLRREKWFGIHVLAGLLFSLVPSAVFALLNLFVCGEFFTAPLLWLAMETAQYLFFFGVAVLCILLTGNRFASLIAYAGLNFLSILVYCVLEALFVPMMYGVVLSEDVFMLLCPLATMLANLDPAGIGLNDNDVYRLWLDAGSWIYLGVAALIGLAALGIALLFYRRRHLERAGDFVAEGWLRPVFLSLYSIFAGTLLASYMSLAYSQTSLGSSIGWIVVGMSIGVITGRMLLQRTVRVFDRGTLRSFLSLTGLMIVILLLFRFDLFGLRRYVPETEQIQSVRVEIGGDATLYDQPEDIEKVVALHEYIVEAYPQEESYRGIVHLTYTMKDGTTVRRQYYLTDDLENPDDPYWDYLKPVTFRAEFILGTGFGPLYQQELVYLSIWDENYGTQVDIAPSQYQGLMEALLADVEAGYLLPDYTRRFSWQDYYSDAYSLDLEFRVENLGYTPYLYLSIPKSAINTVAYIRGLNQ